MIEIIISLLIAFVIVIILYRILKVVTKLIINSIIGIILLILSHFIIGMCNLGFTVDITTINILICAIAGIPGVILVILFELLNIFK
jgi:inhibitor of the pro-sigma K processing machinery